jgi:hypothetical protein
MHRLIDLTERNIAAALPRRKNGEAVAETTIDRPLK